MTFQSPPQEQGSIPIGLFEKARSLAAKGLGHEDIYVPLKNEGLSRKAAWVIVFGKTGVHSK